MQAQFFNHASGVRMTNSNFNVQYISTTPTDSSDLSRLYDSCAPGAFLNSKERYDAPKCSPETRRALISEMKAWIHALRYASSVFWLTGSAGAGKSALSQTLAEQMRDEGLLLGCHFFSRTSFQGHRSDGYRLVPNLIAQLIKRLPEARAHVEHLIQQDRTLFDQHPEGLLNDLFITPLCMVVDPDFGKRWYSIRKFVRRLVRSHRSPLDSDLKLVIIIDGLDECNQPEVQVHLLRMIARAIPKLPHPVRFLIASRPESHIRACFDRDFAGIEVHRINLDEDQNVRKDLERYFLDRFEDIRKNHPALKRQEKYASWPSQEDINRLVAKSSTQFIYADTVMKYISYGRAHPVRQLDRILGLTFTPRTDKPYLALDILYRFILQAIEETDHFTVWEILRIIYLSGRPEFSNSGLRASPAFLETVLDLETGDVLRLLDPLVSLLALPEKENQPIKVLHASLFDYLSDPHRSEDFTILPLSTSHKTLTHHFYRQAVKMLSNPSDDTDLTIVYLRFLRHLELSELSEKIRADLRGLKGAHEALCRTSSGLPDVFHLLFIIKRLLDVFLRKELKDDQTILYKYAGQFYRHFQRAGGRNPNELKPLPHFGSAKTPFPANSPADIQYQVYATLVDGIVTSASRFNVFFEWLSTALSKKQAVHRDTGKFNTIVVHLSMILVSYFGRYWQSPEIDNKRVISFLQGVLRSQSWAENSFEREARVVELGKNAIQAMLRQIETRRQDEEQRKRQQGEERKRKQLEQERRAEDRRREEKKQEDERKRLEEQWNHDAYLTRRQEEYHRMKQLEYAKIVDNALQSRTSSQSEMDSPSDSLMIRQLYNAPQPSPLSFKSIHIVPPTTYPIELRVPSRPGLGQPSVPLILDPNSSNGSLTVPLTALQQYNPSYFSLTKSSRSHLPSLEPSPSESWSPNQPLPLIKLNDSPLTPDEFYTPTSDEHEDDGTSNHGALTLWRPKQSS